ncbi:MSMEG_0569 family flavin-dependent oxidoreductase [Spongisporangium articulatum]|uniref:MSMEG_0569 family flavin-dependent oxidoreductase n=1 Tax=Spongisporangium articulatum TaxID=3362603 RepID=A0ABW8AMP6_9ACTN
MTATSDLAGHQLAGGLDGRHVPVAVIGGGQAGLSASHRLSARGLEHVVLEKHRVGHEWAERRWDSFCLVTPNYQCQLPGFAYADYTGDGSGDGDGFMVKDQIVGYLRAFARSFDAPLHEGVAATRLAHDERSFVLSTSRGTLRADQVVLAAGPYQIPKTPRFAERLPAHVVQLHSSAYRNAAQLPAGEVLVVGTGQSGCQIAEDLHLAGRRVHLATGTAPRVARVYRGKDCMTWLDEIGHYAKGLDEFPDQEATRYKVNHYVTGRDGGRDIDLRAFARDGMRLYGRLRDVDRATGTIAFDDDLRSNLDGADAVAESIKDLVDAHVDALGLDAPPEPRYTPVWEPGDDTPTSLDPVGAGVTSVIWCTGFTRDYSWVDLPAFDGRGYPTHHRGVTSVPGLYVLGMPWQWTWGSGRFRGVADDAEYLAERIQARVARKVAA